MVIDPTSMHVLFIQYPPRTQVFKHKIEVFCFVLFCFVALLLPDAMQGLRKSSENVLKKKKKRSRRRRKKERKEECGIGSDYKFNDPEKFLNLGSCEDQIK